VQTLGRDALDIPLDRALSEALSQLSRERDAAPSAILLSVLKTLLARYSGQSDICLAVFPSPSGNDAGEAAAELLRSSLVLQTEVTPELGFGELVSRVEERTRQARAHGAVSLDRLVDEMLGEPERGRHPLFEVMFAFEDRATQTDADLRSSIEEAVKRQAIEFDLAFQFQQQADESHNGSLEYSRDLFDASTIERMLGRFQHLLGQVVEAPDTPIGELSIITERECEELARWNATEVSYPHGRCLHELFEARVADAPDSCALSFIDHELSYAELNRRSNQLGHRLREMGVGPDVLVGICMDRTEDLVIALMGTLKAGGAYIPLDPEYPEERLNMMIEDAQPLVVISESQYAGLLTCGSAQLFLIDQEREALENESEKNLSCTSAPENLAYVIYTSGSTGKPKGVMVEHRNVVNFLTGMERSLGISSPGVWIGVTSISFDISVLEIFGSLAWGFELAFYPGPRFETSEGESLISRLLRERRVTTLQCTPSLVEILLDDPDARKWLAQLDQTMIGGEALPTALAGELLEVLSGEFYNVYGPTETTIWSTVHRVQPEDLEMGSISIGRPIANTTLFVLDSNDQPLPAGLIGELVIGGVGVTRGYFNRSELTQERFPTASFEAARGERLYRTGDLARFRADGTLECLGRIDFQVKISGHRIELGEIESVLERHDSVQKAVVVAREDASGSKRLVAYIKSHTGVADAEQAQREHLRERLPEFMVPPYFVYLEEYPLTPNGKVDRKALPEPEGLATERAAAYVPPRNPTEERLAEIWADVLDLERVGVRQNFIELGGHSLLGVRLMMSVNEAFGSNLPVGSIFKAPTVRDQAELIRSDLEGQDTGVVRLAQGKGGMSLFCICGIELYQELADALAPEHTVYGVYVPLEDRFLMAAASDQSSEAPPSVSALAAAYLEEIRRTQSHSPYWLAGVSFGGCVAFEIAQQLRAEGEEVRGLYLIDTILPSSMRRDLPRWVAHQFSETRRRGPRHVMDQLGKISPKLAAPLKALVASDEETRGGDVDPLREIRLRRNHSYVAAMRQYEKRIQSYDGDAVLVYALDRSDCPGYRVAPDCGWSRFIRGQFRICNLDVDHLGALRKPEVETLAKEIRVSMLPSAGGDA
jgi:amino acid adenylation domain-containing protein